MFHYDPRPCHRGAPRAPLPPLSLPQILPGFALQEGGEGAIPTSLPTPQRAWGSTESHGERPHMGAVSWDTDKAWR